ncbi:MAG TPA: hypothetical protein VF808_12175 [Ktedonobacterales bacterium]
MARASKTPQRPAPVAGAAAKPASSKVEAARPAVTSVRLSGPGDSMRTTLWLLVLALITGAIPIALAGQTFGYWRIPLSAPAIFSSAPVYDAPLAKPQSMVVNATAQVETVPGSGVTVAVLQPGFPVTVTRYATQGSQRWALIRWAGPVKTAGGSGWTPTAQLTAPGGHTTKPIGDLAAFSPAIWRAANAAGDGFAATLYFPASGYAYHSANQSQTVTLGQQMIPIALVADYGEGLAAHQPSSIPQDVASGNSQALLFLYAQLGGAKGMSAYVAHYQMSGFHFAVDPTQSTATIQGLSQFYTALSQAPLIGPDDQRQVFSLLTGGSIDARAYASASQIGSGALTATTTQNDKGYTTIVAGQLQPTNGPAVIIVAVSADQPSSASSRTALQDFYKSLFATLG